ncbi:MAG: endonuclease/exonuclease/phosphatase family protein [Verrucomicrobiota bacterium]
MRPLLWLGFFLPLVLAAETVTVATYNLQNYLVMDRRVEGRWREDYPKPEAEKAALREVILAMDADILCVQEIGGPEFLEQVQEDLKREGLNYPHRAVLIGPDEVRRVGVLSRIPFEQTFSHDKIAFKYHSIEEQVRRGTLELVFETEGVRWSLFNLHLKSRWQVRDDDPLAAKQRTGEAQAVRDLIRAKYSNPERDRYMIVGDFNDTKESAPLRRFLKVSDRQLTSMLDAVDTRGDAWTFHYRKRDFYERVDFILVSPALEKHVTSARVVDHFPATRTASDHRPVVVTLEF